MSLIANLQAANLEFARKTQFETHNEGEIRFQTQEQEEFSLVNEPNRTAMWLLSETTLDGKQLPPDVQYELRIPEDQLTTQQFKRIVTVLHKSIIYQIIRPSPFLPLGLNRLYRFWLSPQEPE